MIARLVPVEPSDLIVFGATGDLSARKLLPALFQRDLAGQLPDDARVIGASRKPMTDAEFRSFARDALAEHAAVAGVTERALSSFLARLFYIAIDVQRDNGWSDLKEALVGDDRRIRIYYLATGPELFAPICDRLQALGLARGSARVIVEKPIGKDLASARAANDAIAKAFPESSIFRIDHYLGKETVQNLMALRFANALFEPLWNSGHIDHVQITVAETLGVGGRVGYYDSAGALRDMAQNHLLQLLCLVAMEPPTSMAADAVRDEKLKVLQSLAPLRGDDVAKFTVRGQYRAGAAEGGAVKGYLDELGDAASRTETFVAIKAQIANWRWAGVPFYLRTGKRLASRVSEIVVGFRPIPHSMFDASAGPLTPNQLVIRLQPNEGVLLWLMIKDPGPGGMRLRRIPLDMSFAEAFHTRNPDAYERLLMDVVRGNQTLFMRRDEVEAAWAWIDPILEAWKSTDEVPKPYASGTSGPAAAIALIERDGRTWHDDDSG